jgi:hypothetical protein
MRAFANPIVICLTFLVCLSCSTHRNKWTKYSDRTFSASMPEGAVLSDKQEVTPFGKQSVHYVTWKPSTLELNKFKLFQVSYTDCPARFTGDSMKMNAALDSSINIRKRDFTENDVASQPIEINGYPGRAFILDPPRDNVITIVKQVIANNKRYDLVVIAKRDYPTNEEISHFFNSFQVLR